MPLRSALLLSLAISATAFPAGAGGSEPIDENEMFGEGGDIVLDSSQVNRAPPRDDSFRREPPGGASGVRVSGEASMTNTLTFPNSAFRQLDDYEFSSPVHQSRSAGTLLLDAHSDGGVKAFAAIEGEYLSDSARSYAYLRELFVDMNFRRRVYLRMGKQVVKWGTCYLWNPSDLINIERVAFIARRGHLDGTYGLRLHAPVGTVANFYAFLDGNGSANARDAKVSGKAEVVLGGSEISLSSWVRRDLDAVVAASFSTGLSGWQVSGEAALLPRGFSTRYEEREDVLHEIPSESMTPRICLSLARSFDFLNHGDRVRLQYEMYYNGLGYRENPLEDEEDIPWSSGVEIGGQRVDAGSKALWLMLHDRTEPYSLGRYYSAFFTSFSHFIVSDATLSCNGIMNMTDRSAMVVAELAYATLQRLVLRFSLVGVDGGSRTEFAYDGSGVSGIFSVQYPF